MWKIVLLIAMVGIHQQEEVSASSHNKVVVCYWGTWSHYRSGKGQFRVEDVDPTKCTHLIYAFAGLEGNKIKVLDPNLDLNRWDNFNKVLALKRQHSSLKVTLAVGGWNEGGRKFSKMSSTEEGRKEFIESVMELFSQYSFDGLDLDWEYPGKCHLFNWLSLIYLSGMPLTHQLHCSYTIWNSC